MAVRMKPPLWFWAVAVLILLWGVSGVFSFYTNMTTVPADAYDRAFRASQPLWSVWAFAIAVWAGLIGAAALLARSRFAHSLFVLSLIAIIVLFGWELFATDIIAVKGVVEATGFPIFITLMAVFQIWFATLARRRRWVG